MKKSKCIKFNRERFVDGIDVANFFSNTTEEILVAEAKTHNPEIQFKIGKYIDGVFEEDFDELSKKIEKEYPEDFQKYEKVYVSEVNKRRLEWYLKAAEQNYGPAFYELYRLYDEDGNEIESWKNLKHAVEQNYPQAVSEYISLSCNKELPVDFPEYDKAELIKKVCEEVGNGCFWNEKFMKFECPNPLENVSKLNAHLYKMMFRMYDQVKELKTQLNTFIKEGKKYYRNYEINCGIGFYPDSEYKLADGTVFEGADCEWKLTARYGKKLNEKMKALSLWNNYHFDPFEDLKSDYVCRAMYSFVCPEKEKDKYASHKIPLEILKQAKPEDFNISIEITFGKNRLKQKFTHSEWEKWREDNLLKKIHLPSIWQIGPLMSHRILSQAKTLLRIELESADVRKQIKKDFKAAYKNQNEILASPTVGMALSYDHKRIFGIKTKGDSLIENEIQLMCGLNTIGSGNLDDDSNKNDIPQWNEPFIFLNPPYNRHYLCFANHGIWDHCSLRTDQVLSLKPKNFGWNCSVSFDENKLNTEYRIEKGKQEEK